MRNKLNDSAKRREGIVLLLLPLVVLPVLGWWAMNFNEASASSGQLNTGMNTELPQALLSGKQQTKQEAYLSERNLEEMPKELELPAFISNGVLTEEPETTGDFPISAPSFGSVRQVSSRSLEAPSPEKEILHQLNLLESVWSQQEDFSDRRFALDNPQREVAIGFQDNKELQLMQMEQMMAGLENRGSVPDPELAQLESLMDKILMLYHPQLYQDSVPVHGSSGLEALPVGDSREESEEGSGNGWTEQDVQLHEGNGFYGLEERSQSSGNFASDRKGVKQTFLASVARTQEIIPGETLEIQLDQELKISGQLIPIGTIMFAQTGMQGGRLSVQVSGIIHEGSLMTVSLKAMGLDGVSGIELSDLKGSNQWIQENQRTAESLNLNTYGLDWQSQLASSGVQATRSLLKSKAKAKKMSIKAGHPLLLVDTSTQTSHKQ